MSYDRSNVLGALIAAVILGLCIGAALYLFAPMRGEYLVVDGDKCWVVTDRLRYEEGGVWWKNDDGVVLHVSGARYAKVPPGSRAVVAQALGAKNCPPE